jgi:hypothetical protein
LNPDLKQKSCQQWHLYKPNLLIDYFSIIDSIEKAYWLGFLMADGSIITKRYYYKNGKKYLRKSQKKDIFIELSKNDVEILYGLCECLGINYNNIKHRTRKHYHTGKSHDYVYLRITNNKMANELEKQGFSSSKAKRKFLPSFYTYEINKKITSIDKNKLLLGFVRGYYDGDGFSGTTRKCSSSKQFLIRIKHSLKITNKVLKINNSRIYKDEFGKLHIERGQYSLFIGVRLFNEMTLICKESNINLLKRKDKVFSESRDSLKILKLNLKNQRITKDMLQKLVFHYREY